MTKLHVFVCALVLSVSANAQWSRTSGPEGISMNSLITVDGIIYAGTATDGIYASSDNGVSWIARNSGIEDLNIYDMDYVPGFLFAATAGNGVFRSSDGGMTWLPPDNYNNLFVTAIVANDNYVFAGTGSDGVYRSSDFGRTWTQLFGVYGIDAMCKSGNKVFASTYGYTLVSTDNGDSWNYVNSLEGAAPWSFYVSGDTIIAGCVNEIYRSTNGGNSFTEINLGFPYTITNVYCLTASGPNLFAGTSYYGVIMSPDLGSSWTIASNGMGPKDVRAMTIIGTTLIAGTHYVGVYRSSDMASSWNKSMTGFPAGSSVTSMLAVDKDLYAGTRDGIYKTSDEGENWIKLSGTNDTINYGTFRGLCEKDHVIYAGGTLQFNSTVYKSSDGGLTWIRSGNGLPADLTFITAMAASGNNVITATDEGIFYSTDDGNNWYLSGFAPDYVEDMSASSGYVYAIRQFVGIYRSNNDGVSWSLVLQAVADHISMSAYNSQVYVGSLFEACIYSPNYGNSWFQSYGFPEESAVFGFGTVDDNMVLAGTDGSSSYIYASTDGGSYFTPYSEGLGSNAVTEFFAIGDTFMYAGTDYNGVWKRLRPGIIPAELVSFSAKVIDNKVNLYWQTATETNNSGFEVERKKSETTNEEWIRVGFTKGSGTTTESHYYSFTDDESLTGSYSYRLKQTDFDGSFKYSDIVDISVDVPLKFSLEQNYPNPFNPATKIKYSIPGNEYVTLIVYDILGNEVRTLVSEEQAPGNYEVTFNAKVFSSGIYIYKLMSGSHTCIKKMILLK